MRSVLKACDLEDRFPILAVENNCIVSKDADIAVMDCTFLNPDDRDDPTHFTFDEAVAVARSANVQTMIAAHISSRYYELPSDRDTDTGMHVRVVDPAYTFAF